MANILSRRSSSSSQSGSQGKSTSTSDSSTLVSDSSSKKSRLKKAVDKVTYKATPMDEQSYKDRLTQAKSLGVGDSVKPIGKLADAVATTAVVGVAGTGVVGYMAGKKAAKAVKDGGQKLGKATMKASRAAGKAALDAGDKVAGHAALAAVGVGMVGFFASKKGGEKLAKMGERVSSDIKERASTYAKKVMNTDTEKLDAEFWVTSAVVGAVMAGPIIVVGAGAAGALGVAAGVVAGLAPIAALGAAGYVVQRNVNAENLKTLAKNAGQELHIRGSQVASLTGARQATAAGNEGLKRSKDFMGKLGKGVSRAFGEASAHAKVQAQARKDSKKSSDKN